MINVKVLLLRTAGTNCDVETARAFTHCGAEVDAVHINDLICGRKRLLDYLICAIPGGFTYGDDIMAGKLLANELRTGLKSQVEDFLASGRLMIGICNGFQVLVRAGLLPGPERDRDDAVSVWGDQTVSLTVNDSGKFEDRWVYLKPEGRCVWTEGLSDILFCPVAHAEGKFVVQDPKTCQRLADSGQVVFRYVDAQGRPASYPVNPNGSMEDIAGICDRTGRVLGLMPHPERHVSFYQHPWWTRMKEKGTAGDGAVIFANGVRYVKQNLLSSV